MTRLRTGNKRAKRRTQQQRRSYTIGRDYCIFVIDECYPRRNLGKSFYPDAYRDYLMKLDTLSLIFPTIHGHYVIHDDPIENT